MGINKIECIDLLCENEEIVEMAEQEGKRDEHIRTEYTDSMKQIENYNSIN